MVVDNGLSEREIEILQLVATGASNKEIATRLVISPNTVKVHLRNIFSKIEVVSRTEATLYAIRSGLIPSGEGLLNSVNEGNDTGVLPSEIQPGNPFLRWRIPIILVSLTILILAVYYIFRPPANLPDASTTSENTLPSRWLSMEDLPEGRSGLTAVSYEGRIYVIGGQRSGIVSDGVSVYDIQSDTWQTAAPKPTPVTASAAVLIGEKIFMPGGQGVDGKPTAVMEVFDPRTNNWEQAAPMPKARSRFALAALEGKLYVFGGWDGSNFSDAVFQYDAAENSWQERGFMSIPRADGAAAAIGTKIILVGGANAKGIQQDTWAYYPQRENDGEPAWEERNKLPTARSAFSLTHLAGSLYLAGGLGSQAENRLPALRYDDTADQWEELEPAPQPIGISPGAAANGNFIHFFGGSAGEEELTGHQTYQAIFTVLIPAISR